MRATILLGATALTGALAWMAREVAPEPGEALLLRWVRVAGDHPLRTLLGFALLGAALGGADQDRDPDPEGSGAGVVREPPDAL